MPPPAPLADLAAHHGDLIEAYTTAALDQVDTTRINGDPNRWRDTVIDAGEVLLQLQAAAVDASPTYVTTATEAQGAELDADAELNLDGFVDFTDGGGSWLRNLIYAPPSAYQAGIAAGVGDTVARIRAGYAAAAILAGGIRDASRSSTLTAMGASRSVKGYVRALRGSSCARCAILAGRKYRVSAFARHPHCDCYMIPAAEDVPGDWTTDPDRYFDQLPRPEQDRIFGRSGAEAIRLGADMSQVVNASDGISIVGLGAGQEIEVTSAGITVRGLAGQRLAAEVGAVKAGGRYRQADTVRLTPDQIFALAEQYGLTREQLLAQLKRYGYIL